MATVSQRATVDDLYRTEGKAELIGGRIIQYMATGMRPNEVAANIYVSLRSHAVKVKRGKAFTDNMGFVVPELSSGGPLPACPAGEYVLMANVRATHSTGPLPACPAGEYVLLASVRAPTPQDPCRLVRQVNKVGGQGVAAS